MKIAITGEGPTDYGKEDFDTRRREKHCKGYPTRGSLFFI